MSAVVTYEEVLRTAQSLNESERIQLVHTMAKPFGGVTNTLEDAANGLN